MLVDSHGFSGFLHEMNVLFVLIVEIRGIKTYLILFLNYFIF